MRFDHRKLPYKDKRSTSGLSKLRFEGMLEGKEAEAILNKDGETKF